MSSAALRDQAHAIQEDRNPETLAMFIRELGWMRNGRLRTMPTQTFTCEEIIKDAQERIYLKAPTSLYGVISKRMRDLGLIEETGGWVSAKREERHANRVPLCKWKKP